MTSYELYSDVTDPFEYCRQLRRVRAYVERNLVAGVTAEAAAAEAGVSPNYFAEFFRQRVGTTFGQWFRAYRVGQARSRMIMDDTPILEIAFLSGYGSLSSFQRAFKQETGLSPMSWLQTHPPKGNPHITRAPVPF